jgi:hypothetical protein
MKTLKEMIAVMQAAHEGRDIIVFPYTTPERIFLTKKPKWNWDSFNYSIAPKEWWTNFYKTRNIVGGIYASEEEAKKNVVNERNTPLDDVEVVKQVLLFKD